VSLSDAIYGALTGGKSPKDESFARFLIDVKAATGGNRRAAARLVGVPESTYRRWEKGAKAMSAGREKLMQAGRRNQLSPNAPTDRTVKVTTRDQNGKPRTAGPNTLQIAPGTMDRVREAYLRGDHAALGKEFTNGVGDEFYKGHLDPSQRRRPTSPSDLPDGRRMVPGSSLRGDGTESKGSMLEEREDEAEALAMGGAEAMAGEEGEDSDVEFPGFEGSDSPIVDDTWPYAATTEVSTQ
jgi:hypothetical protein